MGLPRNRVLYQSEALFVCTGLATGTQSGNIAQVFRVRDFNNDFNVTREDVTVFGQLDPEDQLITTPPTTSFGFSWYDYGIGNENTLGFATNGIASMISGMLSQATEPYNYYLLTVPEGFDAVGYSGNPSNNDMFGFGNGYISSYSCQGAVGSLPSSTVQLRALNTVFYNGSTGVNSPAITSSGTRVQGEPVYIPVAVSGIAGDVAAIRPGDITINLNNAALGVDLSNVKIQSYNFQAQLNREDINQLGSFFPEAILLNPPFPATLSMEMILGDLNTGDVSSLICNDALYDIVIQLRQPNCLAGSGVIAKQIEFRGGKISSENFQSAIQGNKRLTLSYETRMSSQGTVRGVYLSGVQ